MKNIFLFFLSLVLLTSCKRDRNTTWDTEYLTPIASGELSLVNLLKDSTVKTNSDNSLNLQLDKVIYELEPTRIEIPDTVITSVFNLETLIISDRTISQKVTLFDINPAFALLHGTTQNLPPQNLTDVANEEIDASDFFETAIIKTGFLDMTINNELPVEVTKVVVELRNKNDNSVVVTQTFNNIPPFGSYTESASLDGKTIQKDLIGVIKELVTAGTTSPVLIDVGKGVEMVLGIRDLKPFSAIAAFPTQNVIEQDEGLILEMGDGELKKVLVKTGQMKIDFFTNVREDMTIYFKVPSLTLNDIPIEKTYKVKGASPGTPVQITEVFNLAGYWMDYRGKDPEVTDTVNTFHQILYVTIDSSGRKIPMSLEDSVYMYYGITDIVPAYAEGYFGSTENPTGNESVEFEEFGSLNGDVELDDATVRLKVTNALGTSGLLDINSISSYNTSTKKEVVLNSTIIPKTINVIPARANPLRPWVMEYELTKDNSNIVDFISNLPNELRYNVNLKVNPNGNISNYKDFLYCDTKTSVSLEVDIPLKISTTGLSLQDTVDFEYPIEEENLGNVKSANLYLKLENGFPFEVEPVLLLLAADGTVQDTLLAAGETVAAANIDNLTGDVLSKSNSTIAISVPGSKLDMLKSTSKIIIKARIKTPDAMQGKATIKSTYTISMKIVSDFVYEMGL